MIITDSNPFYSIDEFLFLGKMSTVNIAFIGPDITEKMTLLRLLVKKITEEVIGFSIEDIRSESSRGLSPLKISIKYLSSNETAEIYCFRDQETERRLMDSLNMGYEFGLRLDEAYQSQLVFFLTFLQDIKEQFNYFGNIKYFPKEIHVCINHLETLPEEKKNQIIKKTKEELIQFFQVEKRKKVKGLLFASPVSERGERGINGLLNLLLRLTSSSKEDHLPSSGHDDLDLDIPLPLLGLTEEKNEALNNEFQELKNAVTVAVQSTYKREEYQRVYSEMEERLIDFKEKAEKWEQEALRKNTTSFLRKIRERKKIHERIFSFIDGNPKS